MAGDHYAHFGCVDGSDFSKSWLAKFPGYCGVCGEVINTNARIVRNDPRDENPFAPSKDAPPPPLPPPPPQLQVVTVDPKALSDQLLPKVMTGLRDVLPEMLRAILPPPPVEIKIMDLPVIKVGVQHKSFPLLLRALLAGLPVWIAGPSASGKTTAAMNAAKAMETRFLFTGAISEPHSLLGYRTATGEVIRPPFREAWEHGGVFLWDEIDASEPNALLAFNAALANGACAFPDGIIPKHPGCFLIGAANTWGHGATNDYVGRMKMDAAFLNRFVFVDFPYDEEMEMAIAPNKEWCRLVQQVRKNVYARKLRVLVTPRATLLGSALLAVGYTEEEAIKATLRAGMSDDQWNQVKPVPVLPGVIDTRAGQGMGVQSPFKGSWEKEGLGKKWG